MEPETLKKLGGEFGKLDTNVMRRAVARWAADTGEQETTCFPSSCIAS